MLDSRYAPLILAFVLAAVIGFVTFVLLRPGRRSVRSRIAGFVAGDQPDEQVDSKPRRPPALTQTATQSLRHSRWWGAFCEMVELSRIPVTPGRLALWTGLGTAALAYLFAVPAGRPVLAVASLGLPLATFLVVRARVTKERRAFGDQLPENLQVLASAMRAGHSFLGALSVMADDAGEPSRREFRRALQDEQLGVPVQTALATVATRMRSVDVEYVGLVAQLQTETGGNTAEVLDRVTETIRERNSLHAGSFVSSPRKAGSAAGSSRCSRSGSCSRSTCSTPATSARCWSPTRGDCSSSSARASWSPAWSPSARSSTSRSRRHG